MSVPYAFAGTTSYVYDELNRLKEVHFDATKWIEYSYDEIGNLLAKTPKGDVATITATATGSGNVVLPGATTMFKGNNVTYTIKPDSGYRVVDVKIDGVSLANPNITSYTFPTVTTNHTIEASFLPDTTFTFAVIPGANGTITPNPATALYGDSKTFTITPAANYHVVDVVVDGISKGAVTSYTFSNITTGHTIQASFAINTYPITASIGFPGFGGTISPASATVAHGGSQTFTITPDAGFVITDVKADGVSKGAVTSYSFTNIAAGHTLSASFATTCAATAVKNRRTGTTYATLQAAYNDAALQNGDTILVTGNRLVENFTASGKDISITIDGGYKCDFSSNPYATIITGAPRIISGTVMMNNVNITE